MEIINTIKLKLSKLSSDILETENDESITEIVYNSLYQQINDIQEIVESIHVESESDKYTRLVADFENYKKRTQKEKSDLIINGSEKIIKELLPILDDLYLTIQYDKNDGIENIISKYESILSQNGIIEIESESVLFDPDFHESVSIVPVESVIEHESYSGLIKETFKKGYMYKDSGKIIRHSLVVVYK